MNYRGKKCVAVADIRVRMVVVAGAVVENREYWIHEGHGWQSSTRGASQKRSERTCREHVLQAPQRQPGHIVEVIPMADSGRRQTVEDRRKAGERDAVVETVGLGGPKEHPVRKRRTEDRRKVTVTYGVILRESAVERDIGG